MVRQPGRGLRRAASAMALAAGQGQFAASQAQAVGENLRLRRRVPSR